MCAVDDSHAPARTDHDADAERFRRLVESSPDWTIEVSADGRVAYASPACRSLLGIAPDAFRGDATFLRHVLHADSRPTFDALWESFRRRGAFPEGTYEWTWTGPAGRAVVTDARVANLRDAQGRVTGFVAVCRDVTGQRQAEKALGASEERFYAFMDHCPAIAFVKDDAGRYVYGNRAWAAQFNRPAAELLGRTDDDLWPAEAAARFRATDRAILAGGGGTEGVEAAVTARGGLRHWVTHRRPLPGVAGRLLICGTDVGG